jgi:hypothetical protein
VVLTYGGMTTQAEADLHVETIRTQQYLGLFAFYLPGEAENAAPAPDGLEINSSFQSVLSNVVANGNSGNGINIFARAALSNQNIPAPIRLGALARGLERIEKDQVIAVARIGVAARRKAAQLKAVIMEAGLSPDTLSPPAGKAMGGPFIPLKADPNGSRFVQELGRIAADYQTANRLSHVLYALPLRRPLPPHPPLQPPPLHLRQTEVSTQTKHQYCVRVSLL